MSISSMTSDFLVAAERRSVTKSTVDGSKEISWSTSNRGSLPTSFDAAIQSDPSFTSVAMGIEGDVNVYRVYSATDMKLSAQDRILWVDKSGVNHVAEVRAPSRDMGGKGRLWITFVEESTNRR